MQHSETGVPPMTGRMKLAVLGGLMVTQTFGWGMGLTLLGVLGQPIGADLGLSPGVIFSASIVLYGCAALMAPMAGRLADRIGGARLLAPGAAAGALSLLMLGRAEGPVGYFLAWAVHGLAFHFMLMTACYTAITQLWGAESRRVIGILTLATGLCATLIWPLTQMLQGWLDWRGICLFFAGVTVLVMVPLNLTIAVTTRRHARLTPAGPEAGSGTAAEGEGRTGAATGGTEAAPAGLSRPFVLMALLFGLSAGIGNSVGILIIDIFTGLGLPRTDAVHAASLVGVAFLVARGIEIFLGSRIDPIRMSVLVFAALPVPMLAMLGWALLGWAALPLWLAVLIALAYGAPQGLAGLMRPALVQHLFGTRGFGTILGRLSRVSDIASAVMPGLIAALLAGSATVALWLIAAMALTCCVLVLALARGEARRET